MKNPGIILVLMLFTSPLAARADVMDVDFDSSGTEFWINGTSAGDYSVRRTDEGLGTLAAGHQEYYWRGNGSGRLLTWTNRNSTSGFTLHNHTGALFTLLGFEFGNGYVRGNNAVTSLTLTGYFGNGGTITQTVRNSTNGWTSVSMSTGWTRLQSVVFRAHGSSNRAVWDNIRIAAAVSEPGTFALFGLSLLSAGLMRRRRLA